MLVRWLETMGWAQLQHLALSFVFTVGLAKDGGHAARPSVRRVASWRIAGRQVAKLSDLS